MTDNRVEANAAPSSAQDRQALIAALGFPVLVIIGGVVGYLAPETAASFAPQVTPLLGIVMFGMGLTLKPVDFALVARRPLPVLIGVVAQFVIMPLVALLVVAVMDLPDAVAAGVILVGCAPGGTSSNVVSYLARGDVALSVTMTSNFHPVGAGPYPIADLVAGRGVHAGLRLRHGVVHCEGRAHSSSRRHSHRHAGSARGDKD